MNSRSGPRPGGRAVERSDVFTYYLWAMAVFWVFLVCAGVQCGYALPLFVRVFALRIWQVLPQRERKPVTVIICAKNEADNLRKNLPSVLTQDYADEHGKPMYEVLVVNDASTDDTAKVLQELEQRYDHLWDVTVGADEERLFKGKKHALGTGLSFASHEWLMLTDADCVPAGKEWLARMVAPLAEGKEIVAGYGGYFRQNGLLNAFVRWETVHAFLQYSSYAASGMPYMAVGRNMACTRQVLQKAKGDPVWNKLPSGDDDLLVSIAGTAHNIAIVSDSPAFTRTAAKERWSAWAKQKQRHLSTGKYYRKGPKLLLGLYGASHGLLWILFAVLLWTSWWKIASVVMGGRCVLYWGLWAATVHKLGEKGLIFLFPAFDIGWLVYNFAFFPYIAWKNKTNWT